MKIGETIKKLRKQKDMTQEQLAEYLSISPQAVSRWEINSTLPDITLIPMLANIFDVTSDTLLGIDIEAKEKRIGAIIAEANDYFFKMQLDEAEKLLRAGLKEFPNSFRLMNNLASTLSAATSSYNLKWDEEKKKQIEEERKPIREEIITLCEKILAECTEDSNRHEAIQGLCRTYAFLGETKKAVSMANKMPHRGATRENLITETLGGMDKFKHIQEMVCNTLLEVLNWVATLKYIRFDDGTEPYSTDEKVTLDHKIIDIVNILIEKGSFGDFDFPLMDAHHNLALCYIQKNDIASALNHFKLAVKHAALFDSMPTINDDSKEEYTSLLFRGIKFPFNMICSPTTMTEQLLESTNELDSVFPASELEGIRNELRSNIRANTKTYFTKPLPCCPVSQNVSTPSRK